MIYAFTCANIWVNFSCLILISLLRSEVMLFTMIGGVIEAPFMAQNTVNFKDDLYALGKECVFSAGCRFLNLSIRSSMITKSLKYFVSCPNGNTGRCGFQEAGRRTGHGHCRHRVSFRKSRVQIPKRVGPSILSA